MFEGSKLDTFFICLLIIVISIIFGMNIISLIDKKISNVSINIPPIKVPQPSVVVHIHKSNGSIKTVNNKNFDDGETSYEHFASVLDDVKADIKNSDDEKVNDTSGITVINPEKPESDSNLKNPSEDDIVTYNVNTNRSMDDINNTTTADKIRINKQSNNSGREVENEKADANRTTIPKEKDSWVHCDNSSVNSMFQNGRNSISKHKIHACKDKYDPKSFYQHYSPPVAYLEDYKLKGSNYGDYNNTVSPYDAGVRLLPKDNEKLYPSHSILDKIPKAMNHIF